MTSRPRTSGRAPGQRRATATAIAGVLALGIGISLAAGPASAEEPASTTATDWVDVGHEHVSGQDSYLYDAWSSGDETWHVGTRRADFGGVFEWRNLVQRCDVDSCTPTYPQDIEAPPYTSNHLEGITGTSPSDVWVAGYARYPGPPARTRPTIHRWNGTSWQIQSNPVTAGALWDISARTTSDIWAVGSDNTGAERPLVMHWDGSTWSVVPVTDVGGCTPVEHLRSVDATRRYPVVIGRCRPGGTGPAEGLVMTYRKGVWKRVAPEGVTQSAVTYDAVAWVGKQAWVGGYRAGESFMVRLKKNTWRPMPGTTPAQVQGIAGSSPKDVWAVGYTSWPNRFSMHWDGKRWTQVDAGSQPGPFEAVTIRADGTPWASGQRLGQSMIARYLGPAGLG